MRPIDQRRALTFGRVADEYARWRPSYPADAVAWLAPAAPGRVADVGAGTGKLTGHLLARGLDVEAVEPDPDMLAVLGRLHPEATMHGTTSDALPFAAATVDAVLAADAWHWFPFEETTAEVRRVLKPGGWLGLVWNKVTPVERWEFELAGIDPDRKGLDDAEWPQLPFPTTETEIASFPWTWHVTPTHFRGYLATNSAVVAVGGAERTELLDAAEALLDTVRESRGTATVPLRHEAHCIRWISR